MDFSSITTDRTENEDCASTVTVRTDNEGLSQKEPPSKKRTIQELFGDIDDLLGEHDAKKAKTNRTELEMIDYIVELRQIAKEKQNGALFSRNSKKITSHDIGNNLSYRVPKYPFLAVTRHDGERIYIRCHSEQYEKDEMLQITQNCSFKNIMKDMFKDTWKEAEKLLNKETYNDTNNVLAPIEDNNSLWVELYKPRKYMELLSDETTNRTMLKWMKLWDKVVFGRKPRIKTANPEHVEGKFKNAALENLLKVDENGIPEYKVALLCGPPGLGKKDQSYCCFCCYFLARKVFSTPLRLL